MCNFDSSINETKQQFPKVINRNYLDHLDYFGVECVGKMIMDIKYNKIILHINKNRNNRQNVHLKNM